MVVGKDVGHVADAPRRLFRPPFPVVHRSFSGLSVLSRAGRALEKDNLVSGGVFDQ